MKTYSFLLLAILLLIVSCSHQDNIKVAIKSTTCDPYGEGVNEKFIETLIEDIEDALEGDDVEIIKDSTYFVDLKICFTIGVRPYWGYGNPGYALFGNVNGHEYMRIDCFVDIRDLQRPSDIIKSFIGCLLSELDRLKIIKYFPPKPERNKYVPIH